MKILYTSLSVVHVIYTYMFTQHKNQKCLKTDIFFHFSENCVATNLKVNMCISE